MSYDMMIRRGLTDAKYREQEKTRKAITETINHWKGLKPVMDSFVFNNGSSKTLMCLRGTVPITYKSNTYHIPVTIWLLDTHPYNAPMVYVNPTPDMRVKVSKHVDHNGKVYLPYLHDWNQNTSDLLTLIQVMICTFSEQPPVYAVPQQAQMASPPYPTPYPAAQGGYPGMGVGTATPYPAMPAMPMPMSAGVTGGGPQPPMPMPGAGSTTSPTGTLGSSFSFRPSLISACEEKLKRRLEDVYLSGEILKMSGNQLQQGQKKLDAMVKRLDDEKIVLEKNIENCQKECEALDEKISKSNSEENTANLDDAIQAPAPLYKQIVNTVAEEAALEDTIYYVGEAFRREQMDVEQYLRTVRQLSRRQFYLRAILRKCRQKAGIAG